MTATPRIQRAPNFDLGDKQVNQLVGQIVNAHLNHRLNEHCACNICLLNDELWRVVTEDKPASPADAAHLSIRLVQDAGEQVAQAHDTVTRLADGRAEAKAAAILRLMQTMNPLTHKQHSAASAEAVVESDLDYASYRAVERAAEVERWRALAHYESAKLVAALDVGLAQTTNGMRNSE